MAEQLTFQALLERRQAEPGAKEEEQAPVARAPLPSPPTDPLASDLFTGAPMLRARLVAACASLDAAALRQVHAELARKFQFQEWAARAPAWAAGIEWLTEHVSTEEQLQRALELMEEPGAAQRFPEAPASIVRPVRRAALGRAAQRLVADGGPAALLADGRPAALLPLLAGDAALAFKLLQAACEDHADAGWFASLAQAATLCGDAEAALRAWCRAGLVEPLAVEVSRVETPAALELLDLAEDLELPSPHLGWLPVLADLTGAVPLDELAERVSSLSLPQQVAAMLRTYRVRRRELDERARVAAKRELVRLAPVGLRELLRPV